MKTRPDFGKNFFEKYQSKLVRFANSWIGRKFFDFKGGFGLEKIRVMALYPNAVSYDWKVRDGKLVKTTCFSTDNHYQKKLEHAYGFLARFLPLSVASQMLEPATAYGLALPLVALTTSTFYSVDASDGYIQVSDASFATGRAATSGTFNGGTSAYISCFVSGNYYFRRFFCSWDTSAIPDGDDISTGTISLAGDGGSTDNGDSTDVDIVEATPTDPSAIADGDFDQITFTPVATSIALSSWVTTNGTYNDFPLSDISGISKDGYSSYAALIARDTDNSAPTGVNQISTKTGGAASGKPKLVVEHSAPAPEPSVSDTVTVGESNTVTVFPPDLAINVNDSVTVAEDVDSIIDSLVPSVSDSVTVTEVVEDNITPLYISVDDSVAIAEDMEVVITPLNIFVDDSVAVAESISTVTSYSISVIDSVAIAESVSLIIEQLTPSVDDSVTIAEDVALNITPLNISVDDSVTVAESVTVDIIIDRFPSVSDSVVIAESVSLIVDPLNISVDDSVTVGDMDTEELDVNPTEDDTVTVGESVTMMMDLNVVASDTVTVAESVNPDMWMARAGLVHMRSTEQEYPLMMDEDETD